MPQTATSVLVKMRPSVRPRSRQESLLVDLTFGEYLRALVTADHDLVADDTRGYRVAFISAFRARGIYPQQVRSLAPESVLWQPPLFRLDSVSAIIRDLRLTWAQSSERYEAFASSQADAVKLQTALVSPSFSETEINCLGLIKTREPIDDYELEGRRGRVSRIEVHSVRPARRVGPSDEHLTEVVIEITQSFQETGHEKERGGVTLICNPQTGEVRYVIPWPALLERLEQKTQGTRRAHRCRHPVQKMDPLRPQGGSGRVVL